MDIKTYMDFLHIIENLKCSTRHSWTSSGRHESVAEHSFRLALMAFLAKDEFPGADMDKVIKMCLIHDLGEAVTGDIPSFYKTKDDEKTEDKAVDELTARLPEPIRSEFCALFNELKELKTTEARITKAFDKMEAVIQHNEADISTWLPLEYELNLTYGEKETSYFEFTKALKKEANRITLEKISQAKKAE